jgi:hemerythrin-like metal-binding protein
MDCARIGNTILDDGHETLARQIRALWDFWRDAGDRDGMVAALNAFIGQLRCHFSLEEVILQGSGYPDCDRHATRHQQILTFLTETRNSLSEDPMTRPFQVMQQINSVLCEHELSEDSAYWPWLKSEEDELTVETESGVEPRTETEGTTGHKLPSRRRTGQWDDGYLTGNPQIDAHHRALIQHAERLSRIAARDPLEAFHAAAREFRALAGHHFQVEELVLEGRDDAAASSHRTVHGSLLRSLDSMIDRVGQGRLAPLTFVQDFLSFWMLNHIAESDLEDFAGEASPEEKSTGL